MQTYHAAWLVSHPGRDGEWLSRMIDSGFTIHHIDGDHGNDTPENLVLIEHDDHMRLHGLGDLRKRPMIELQRDGIAKAKALGKYKGRKRATDATQDAQAVELVKSGMGATATAAQLGISRQAVHRAIKGAGIETQESKRRRIAVVVKRNLQLVGLVA